MADSVHKWYESYNDKSSYDWQTILDDDSWKAIWKDWQDREDRKNDEA